MQSLIMIRQRKKTFSGNEIFKFFVSDHLKDCLESDVHHMTSQVLSILIDFI